MIYTRSDYTSITRVYRATIARLTLCSFSLSFSSLHLFNTLYKNTIHSYTRHNIIRFYFAPRTYAHTFTCTTYTYEESIEELAYSYTNVVCVCKRICVLSCVYDIHIILFLRSSCLFFIRSHLIVISH